MPISTRRLGRCPLFLFALDLPVRRISKDCEKFARLRVGQESMNAHGHVQFLGRQLPKAEGWSSKSSTQLGWNKNAEGLELLCQLWNCKGGLFSQSAKLPSLTWIVFTVVISARGERRTEAGCACTLCVRKSVKL